MVLLSVVLLPRFSRAEADTVLHAVHCNICTVFAPVDLSIVLCT